jgi:hypothetical protein
MRQKDAPRFGARNSAFIAQHGDDPFGAPRFTALEADCATRRFYSAAATSARDLEYRPLHLDRIKLKNSRSAKARARHAPLIAQSRDNFFGLLRH